MTGYASGHVLRLRAPRPTCSATRRARSRSPARARGSSCSTGGATRRTRGGRCSTSWRAGTGVRSPSTCPGSVRRRRCSPARCSRSWTRSPPSWSPRGRTASPSCSPAPRSAGASRCGSPSTRVTSSWPASCRSRRTGSSCRAGSTRSRRTRSSAGCCRCRSRYRASSCARAPGTRTAQLAFSHPREAQRAVVETLGRSTEHARGRRRAAGVRPRARARAGQRAVRPGRHPLPRAARVGRVRPDAPAQRRADGVRLRCRRRRSS